MALKSRTWDGGVWAVVEARRMSSLSRRSALGWWIWYSEKFSRRSLFLRWSSLPRPSSSPVWSKFDPFFFCRGRFLRYLVFRSGVVVCLAVLCADAVAFHASVPSHGFGLEEMVSISSVLGGFFLPEFSCGGHPFLRRRRWRACFRVRVFAPFWAVSCLLGRAVIVGFGFGF